MSTSDRGFAVTLLVVTQTGLIRAFRNHIFPLGMVDLDTWLCSNQPVTGETSGASESLCEEDSRRHTQILAALPTFSIQTDS
ncbi:hypothetical protein NHX12_028395 [Muraenolepis orangiensis]|uniref:Uncharacterized protein n=1 Tax=Muraenolepis orangiensis TaxID=630683 RepID=A0A9Q0EDX8_9TELE|nr:hypothetical protein NHX12_028395 [Muraenolepis orangiensis]